MRYLALAGTDPVEREERDDRHPAEPCRRQPLPGTAAPARFARRALPDVKLRSYGDGLAAHGIAVDPELVRPAADSRSEAYAEALLPGAELAAPWELIVRASR